MLPQFVFAKSEVSSGNSQAITDKTQERIGMGRDGGGVCCKLEQRPRSDRLRYGLHAVRSQRSARTFTQQNGESEREARTVSETQQLRNQTRGSCFKCQFES